MKRFNLFALASLFVLGAALFTSCGEKEPPKDSIKLNSGVLSFSGADNEAQTVTVETNIAWTAEVATEDKDWITVTGGSGEGNGSFSVTVKDNIGAQLRSGLITVKGGTADPKTVTVKQMGTGVPSITTDVQSVTINTQTNLTKEIKVTLNNLKEYTATLEKNVDWLEISQSGNTITLVAQPNLSWIRDNNIIITAPGLATPKTLYVAQGGGLPDMPMIVGEFTSDAVAVQFDPENPVKDGFKGEFINMKNKKWSPTVEPLYHTVEGDPVLMLAFNYEIRGFGDMRYANRPDVFIPTFLEYAQTPDGNVIRPFNKLAYLKGEPDEMGNATFGMLVAVTLDEPDADGNRMADYYFNYPGKWDERTGVLDFSGEIEKEGVKKPVMLTVALFDSYIIDEYTMPSGGRLSNVYEDVKFVVTLKQESAALSSLSPNRSYDLKMICKPVEIDDSKITYRIGGDFDKR